MKSANKTISFTPEKQFEYINLTEDIKKFVEDSGIKNGLLNVQSMHTTGVIIVNEDEPLLKNDIIKRLDQIIPQDNQYTHDDFSIRTVNMCDDECANGHAHCKAVLMQPYATLNVIDGKLQLGQWQQIFFFELDRKRPRKVQIMVIGE